MTDQPIDRIPLARSVHYVARNLPEVPNQYGPGVLAPSEITLTYRSATDSQLGRVHAYVAGRIWVDGKETPLLPGGLYGQHYFDGLDGWPDWLAEEARLHDPEKPAASTPAADQNLRDLVRKVLCEWDGKDYLWGTDMLEPDEYGPQADEVLTVVRTETEAHRLALSQALGLGTGAPWDTIQERAAELAQQAGEGA